MSPRFSLAVLLLAACQTAPTESADPSSTLADRVRWTSPEATETVPIATLPAEVVADAAAEAHLGPGIDGHILSWRVRPGSKVSVGDVLADVQSGELTARLVEIEAFRTARGQAAEQLRLAEAAREAGVGTAPETARAAADHADAAARYSSAEATLRALRGSVVYRSGGWVWTAPRAGIVDSVTCREGRVSAPDRCLRLVSGEGDGKVIEVGVPERVLTAIDASGGNLSGIWTGLDGESTPVAFLAEAPAIDPHTRQLRTRFSAPSTARVGASGRLELRVPGNHLLRIPTAAVVVLSQVDRVFVNAAPDHPDALPVPAEDPVAWAIPVEVLGHTGTDAIVSGLPVEAPPMVATGATFLLKSLALREMP